MPPTHNKWHRATEQCETLLPIDELAVASDEVLDMLDARVGCDSNKVKVLALAIANIGEMHRVHVDLLTDAIADAVAMVKRAGIYERRKDMN